MLHLKCYLCVTFKYITMSAEIIIPVLGMATGIIIPLAAFYHVKNKSICNL